MARRTEQVLIEHEGRDKGKVFLIEEMPALQAEEWFFRALQLLARGGADIPDNIFDQGAMGFAALGIGACLTGLAKSEWYNVKPLWDELLQCVKELKSGPSAIPIMTFQEIIGQVEEPVTFTLLRERILSLHLGFSLAARLSYFSAAVVKTLSENGPNILTFPDPSQPASPPN